MRTTALRLASAALATAALASLGLVAAPRPAGAGPLDAAGVAEGAWPGGPADGGVVVGTATAAGAPVATVVELRRTYDLDAAGALFGDTGALLRVAVGAKDRASAKSDVRVDTGSSGAFRFVRLPGGVYEVRAPKLGGQGIVALVVIEGPRHAHRLELDAPAGSASLAGRVLGADGKPRRAVVTASPMRGLSEAGKRCSTLPVETDASGRFLLTKLPPGPVGVFVSDPADASLRVIQTTVPRDDELKVTAGPAVKLRGRVLDADGEPAGLARLRVFETRIGSEGDDVRIEYAEAVCAADGSFAWDCPFHPRELRASAEGKGRGRLDMRRAGDEPETFEGLLAATKAILRESEDDAPDEDAQESEEPAEPALSAAKGAAPPDAPLEVRLERPGRIEGRVREGARGVGGVRVAAVRVDRFDLDPSMLLDTGIAVASSRPDGSYEFADLAPGSYLVAGGGQGFMPGNVAGVSAGAGVSLRGSFGLAVRSGAVVVADLTVIPTATIEGTVVGPDGRPAGDALVAAEEEGEAVMRAFSSADVETATLTAANGKFVLESVPPNVRVRIAARGRNGAIGISAAVTVAERAKKTVGVTLATPAFADVTVLLDVLKEPVPGAVIRADTESADLPIPAVFGGGTWVTDAAGRARVGPIPPQGARLSVSAPDRLARVSFDLPPPGRSGTGFEYAVNLPPPGRVTGKVVVPVGAPIERVKLEFRAAEADAGADLLGALRFGFSDLRHRIGKDGRFLLECDRAGTARVVASLAWQGEYYEASAPVETPESGVTLRLTPFQRKAGDRRIVVRVVGPNGEPIPSMKWRVLSHSSSSVTTVPDRATGAEIGRIVDGIGVLDPSPFVAPFATGAEYGADLWLDAWDPYDGEKRLPYGAVRIRISPKEGRYEIALAPERQVTVTAVGPDEKGVEGVVVRLRHLDLADRALEDRSSRLAFRTVRTGADGSAVVPGLGPLPFLLEFEPPEAYVPPRSATAGKAAGDRIVVRLMKGARAAMAVVDMNGAPVPGLRMLLYPHMAEHGAGSEASQRARSATTLADDAYVRLHRPAAKALRSFVADANGHAEITGFDLSEPRDLVLRPPPDRSDLAAKEIVNWDGGDLRVVMQEKKGSRFRVLSSDGTPAGRYTLWRRSNGTWRHVVPPREAKDGTLFLESVGASDEAILATESGRAAPVSKVACDAWSRRAVPIASLSGSVDLKVDENARLSVRLRGGGSANQIGFLRTDPRESAEPGGSPSGKRSRYGDDFLGAGGEDDGQFAAAHDGVLEFTGLDSDEVYVLHAVSSEGKAVVRRGCTPSGGSIVVDLEPTVAISGRIVPAPRAGETARFEIAEPGLGGSVDVAEDGRFSVIGLPAGTWRIRLSVLSAGRVLRERVVTAKKPVLGDVTLVDGSAREARWEASDRAARDPKKRDAAQVVALSIDPSDPVAGPERARDLLENGRADDALLLLNRVLEVWPHDVEALQLRAEAHWNRGNLRAAVDDCRHIVARRDGGYVRYLLAWYLNAASDLAAAAQEIDRAVELDPNYRGAWELRIDVRHGLGKPSEALAAATEGLAHAPNDPDVRIAAARVMRRFGRDAEAMTLLNGWIAAHDDNVEQYRSQRALARLEAGDAAGAEEDFRDVASAGSGANWIRPWLWVARARQGRLEEANQRISVIAADIGSGRRLLDQVIRYLAGVETAQGLYAVADPDADKAKPGDARAKRRAAADWYIAEKHRAAGEKDLAIEAYHRAVATAAEGSEEYMCALRALAAYEAGSGR